MTVNAVFSNGPFLENFLIGAAAGAVGVAGGFLVGAAIGPVATLGGAILKGAAIGAVASTSATAINMALSGESLTSNRGISKLLLSGIIGAAAGGIAGWWSYDAPIGIGGFIDKGVQTQGEVIDKGTQETIDFIFDMKYIECAPLKSLNDGSFEACMGAN
jgi:hypothetical protein